jgi:hypothetical protein
VPTLVRPSECVLEDLFSGLGVAGQAVRRAVDRRPVAHEERLEGVKVVALHPLEKRGLFGTPTQPLRIIDRFARGRSSRARLSDLPLLPSEDTPWRRERFIGRCR